jgi:hypothetical protein
MDPVAAARKKIVDDEASSDQAAQDDALLEEWRKATQDLRAGAPNNGPAPRAPGEPLAETSQRGSVEAVRRGYSGEAYFVPVGGTLDVAPTEDGTSSPADGMRWLETPFSAMRRDLDRADKNSPEYKRVQDLYGPARIAYHRKNNLDISTGKSRK